MPELQKTQANYRSKYMTENPAAAGPGSAAGDPAAGRGAGSAGPDPHLAYATSSAGSDWLTWRVRDVASGADSGGVLGWSKSSAAEWARDGSGFFYATMNPPGPGREFRDASDGQAIAEGADRLAFLGHALARAPGRSG
jgi:Prolyl oligopeptidase, N-terminal beta-propeller domain